ncbi:MAG: glycerol-3-phosphate dehydrogenase [Acidimicrobiales bacterium mtb01]|nr:glycerol-3-phosphate dehydrogenase/oxidase [Actinomycetota bacterium]TEX45513.1 MAG: glycerol-3-phosphate dehydrogenase [Acidimicrobiales bacterium mtb01]
MTARLERPIERLSELFDVLVIGGGITGVCVAREAASRGLRTALLERDDFGSGTSSATTKYIHGGIRYLEQYDVAVVRESLRERRILALGAPHLVEQTQFIMPAWRWSKPPTPLLGAGVLLYDALSFDRNVAAPDSLRIPHPKWLSKSALLKRVPWLDADGLQGGFAYHDTLNLHPERLLLAYAQSAAAAGAVLVNHVAVDSFIGRDVSGDFLVEGVRATDRLGGRSLDVRARVVVNAAGPWIDKVLATLGRSTGVGVDRSKGVHVLTRPLGGGVVRDAVFARAQSGRHVIVSPWMGKSFIGPTDTPITDSDPTVAPDDVDLILDTVNSTMSGGEAPLTFDDVELTTIGVRPLIKDSDATVDPTNSAKDSADDGADTYSASRRHELYHHVDRGVRNLWSIGGGKWTTARATAEEMVDELAAHELNGIPMREFDTRSAAAHGTFAWADDAEPFLAAAAASLVEVGLSPQSAELVARLHGTDHRKIVELVSDDPALASPIAGSGDVEAQVIVAVVDEAARTLADIIDRRLVLGTVSRVPEAAIRRIAHIAAPLLGWDESRRDLEIRAELDRRAALDSHWRVSPARA